ncbi:MAG: hypothetical protein A2787_07460 [Omnitrophica WOR_2 bacterium RIFCSPHIGHO2_01_FULL_48_9]|nr:MAG: hypothetical protein A3D10_00340 [Omnitrophica WOR_2 bacterium RIFCSPHIGHO2_02_FULL_48_11]OGX32805.1 MAG: hypothetical protein A2787_07460 [Omnitrophica WOR_2 bacterium RIFCSPHIGHO2_01_FULL_48_9]
MTKQLLKLGKVPLERALSKLGIASRHQTRQWILAGRIKVDHTLRRDPDFLVIPEKAFLELDDRRITPPVKRTIVLYKPRGVVTTRSDERGRRTVFSLLGKDEQSLHAVGRLDMATSGLLLLTNDSQFSAWLTDPVNHIPRVYLATVQGRITEEKLDMLKSGVKDRGERLAAQSIILRKASGRESHLTIELTEGKNREIRRMLAVVGHEVISLKRVAFGGLTLGTLQPGQYQELSREQLRKFFQQVPMFGV